MAHYDYTTQLTMSTRQAEELFSTVIMVPGTVPVTLIGIVVKLMSLVVS